jgi:nucleotide-binding universal stress UspA family protein
VHVALEAQTEDARKRLLQRFLQRHGVEARYHTLAGTNAQIGDLMLSLAADLSADLMVMGCYGHSRGRELVLAAPLTPFCNP